jgi:exodeoxyribonuclease V
MIALSLDQQKALHDLMYWYQKDRNNMQYVTLGGFAGTGKTTLIAILRKELSKIDKNLKVGFASFTGKAARVLKTKLVEENAILKPDTVGTIHSLIYSPIINEKNEIIGWKTKEKIDKDLIIIDEGSMVDEIIWSHLLDYKIPIIVVGDHGQLPPIQGRFNLMQKPDLILEEIHRQAEKNPIIGISIQARTNGFIRPGNYSKYVKKYSINDFDKQDAINELLGNYKEGTLILCGYNHTRKKLNAFIRNSLGIDSPNPVKNDRVICLRNNHRKNIYNGMLGTIINIKEKNNEWYLADIKMDEEENIFEGYISTEQFKDKASLNFTDKRSKILAGDLFDFGYALTVHKAQGSQAKKVILFEERFKQMTDDDFKKWLYTAVTRAEEELYIF